MPTGRGTDLVFRALVLSVAFGAACAPSTRVAGEVIDRFAIAVQAEDLDALYCLLAGASLPQDSPVKAAGRESFDAWARSRYERYLTVRDAGGADFEDTGIVMVKTFALGKGAFHRVESVRHSGPDTLSAGSVVRFGYGQIDYSGLSPGTTFYLAGSPPGVIHAIKVPHDSGEVSAEVLDSLELVWELARAPATPECPERWVLVSVGPVPGSETTTRVTWRF